jgi:NAD(P)-dependent dehydrogenase (short-subunit alcohol dehydrogenase family)
MSNSTWLITGASSGLGYALAEHVLKQGDRVVLAARNVAPMQALAASFPETALAVRLDNNRSRPFVRPRSASARSTISSTMLASTSSAPSRNTTRQIIGSSRGQSKIELLGSGDLIVAEV